MIHAMYDDTDKKERSRIDNLLTTPPDMSF